MRNSTIQIAENVRAMLNSTTTVEGGTHRAQFEQEVINLCEAVLEDAQGGSASTHAYDMLADYSKIDLDNLESLINLTAAVVLMQGMQRAIDWETPGVRSVEFSPKEMDDLIRNYEVTSDRTGLLTKVVIKRKHREDGIMEHGTAKEAAAAQPQAEAKVHDRPIWTIRFYGKRGKPHLNRMDDRAQAEERLSDYVSPLVEQPEPTIENRFCLHPGCPSDRCLFMEHPQQK
jgi:hypothetical protein